MPAQTLTGLWTLSLGLEAPLILLMIPLQKYLSVKAVAPSAFSAQLVINLSVTQTQRGLSSEPSKFLTWVSQQRV